MAYHLKLLFGSPTNADGGLLKQTQAGVKVNGFGIGQVGRRTNGEVIGGLVGVVGKRNDLNAALQLIGQPPFSIDHTSIFPQSEAVYDGDIVHPQKPFVLIFHHRSIDIMTIRIGPVQ